MKQPPGYVHLDLPYHVCHLQKALYSLKQSPRAWYQSFDVYISSTDFFSSRSDSSLFVYRRGPNTYYLFLYVDDIILTTSAPTLITQVISCISSEFSMTDRGTLSLFLGIFATQTAFGLNFS